MDPGDSTRTLIVGTFALTGLEELTASQLIALAEPCSVTATNLKSHLTRMVADGSLERSERPRSSTYRPSQRRRGVMDAIRTRLSMSEQKWDGAWVLVLGRPVTERRRRSRLRRRLEFDGFRPWSRDTFARPAWPRPWALDKAAAHAGEAGGIRWEGGSLTEADAQRLISLYHLDALHRRAQRLAHLVQRHAATFYSPRKAWAHLVALGGRVIRTIGEDPLLPPEIWRARMGMRELVAAYREFERTAVARARPFVQEALRAGESPSSSRSREIDVA
jgi:DNA-binding transcriptional regulator PaaX